MKERTNKNEGNGRSAHKPAYLAQVERLEREVLEKMPMFSRRHGLVTLASHTVRPFNMGPRSPRDVRTIERWLLNGMLLSTRLTFMVAFIHLTDLSRDAQDALLKRCRRLCEIVNAQDEAEKKRTKPILDEIKRLAGRLSPCGLRQLLTMIEDVATT